MSFALVCIKFWCFEVGVPSCRRLRRKCETCEFAFRWISSSLVIAWRLDRKYVLTPCPWYLGSMYSVYGGSLYVRPRRGFSFCCILRSILAHRSCGRWAGSGLKLISELISVLCAYNVAGRLMRRLVMSPSRVCIFCWIVVLEGVVSPSILSRVPKCFAYGGGSCHSPVSVLCRSCVAMLVSSGHSASKFQAKLVIWGVDVPGGSPWI